MRKIDKVFKPEIDRVIAWLGSGLVKVHRVILDEDLAEGVGGVCCYDTKAQDYMILVTENQPEYVRLLSFQHELWHLANNDFRKKNVQRIESVAHWMELNCFYGIFDNYKDTLLEFLLVAPVHDMVKEMSEIE